MNPRAFSFFFSTYSIGVTERPQAAGEQIDSDTNSNLKPRPFFPLGHTIIAEQPLCDGESVITLVKHLEL